MKRTKKSDLGYVLDDFVGEDDGDEVHRKHRGEEDKNDLIITMMTPIPKNETVKPKDDLKLSKEIEEELGPETEENTEDSDYSDYSPSDEESDDEKAQPEPPVQDDDHCKQGQSTLSRESSQDGVVDGEEDAKQCKLDFKVTKKNLKCERAPVICPPTVKKHKLDGASHEAEYERSSKCFRVYEDAWEA